MASKFVEIFVSAKPHGCGSMLWFTLNGFYPKYFTSFLLRLVRVKLAVNRETQEAIAVKIIDLDRVKDASDNVKKEVSFGYTVTCTIYVYTFISLLALQYLTIHSQVCVNTTDKGFIVTKNSTTIG